jgi:hypothetical protein
MHDGRQHIGQDGMKNSIYSEQAETLRSEIAQLEARYDGFFPPGVYLVLESLRRELVALTKSV